MQGLRSTLALVVILAGLGAYIYFVESKKDVSGVTKQEKVFLARTGESQRIRQESMVSNTLSARSERMRPTLGKTSRTWKTWIGLAPDGMRISWISATAMCARPRPNSLVLA